MAFLSGSFGFDRFQIVSENDLPAQFGPEQIEVLEKFASGKFQASSEETIQVGFIGGDHLLDNKFDLEKNIINDALHCGFRIDTNQVPSALKKAWLQLELATLAAENSSGRPTKAQRTEAKEAVEHRCQVESATGKYRKMQQFPILWDSQQDMLYLGGSSSSAAEKCSDLFQRSFELDLSWITSGTIALQWAEQEDRVSLLEAATPSIFDPKFSDGEITWFSKDAENFNFLGNEFLLWLWWYLETKSDTLTLSDGSEATLMLTKTLSLECPRGESGKETISAEAPTQLIEAAHAIRSGKLPRKSGMTLVRNGQQFDFVLQAETFSISGAKIQADENEEDERARMEGRIDSIRNLSESIDLVFHSFLDRRIGKSWNSELDKMRGWLSGDKVGKKKPAA